MLVLAVLAVAACGANDDAARTKNAAVGISSSTIVRSQCSSLGAIYKSEPIIVPPPEPNSAEQSFSGSGECSFYETYKSFPGIGRYEFIWDAATTPKAVSGRPVVVEVSRDGVLWTALATDWSPKKPHSAVAYLTMSGNLRVRVRPS